ncbi:MAG: hypothetical protein M1834_007112, partial [Cirrosporium novae-zelandiae]
MSTASPVPSRIGSTHHHNRIIPFCAHPPPAPGSLRGILLKNCRTRLYIHPLEWTADHLKALNIDLAPSTNVEECIVDDVVSQDEEWTQLLGAVWELEHARAISKDQQTRQLVKSTANAMRLHQQAVFESTLALEYNHHSVARLPLPLVAWHRTSDKEKWMTPIWAYVDHKWTSTARREQYNAGKKSWSFATKAIRSKQELVIDPLYIAILIALGQARRRDGPQGSKSVKVSLFVPEHESNTTALKTRQGRRASKQIVTKLVQYIADIPYAYLQKFDEPYEFYDASLHIEKRTLPTNEPSRIGRAMTAVFYDAIKDSGSLNLKRKRLKN